MLRIINQTVMLVQRACLDGCDQLSLRRGGGNIQGGVAGTTTGIQVKQLVILFCLAFQCDLWETQKSGVQSRERYKNAAEGGSCAESLAS
jgi:hypothetical protein